jgi:hypothetical protein
MVPNILLQESQDSFQKTLCGYFHHDQIAGNTANNFMDRDRMWALVNVIIKFGFHKMQEIL